MRVAVTGGTGFIGGHLFDRLLADGHHITAVVRKPTALPTLKARGITAVLGDVRDQASLERAFPGNDVVFHLARVHAHGTRPKEAFAVNVVGTKVVARAAVKSGVARVVHCSSSAVYGARSGFVNEDSPLRPDSAYARSKLRGESILTTECGNRIESVIARITVVLGPRGMSWLSLFRSVALGKFRLPGDGSNVQHPADVSDIVEGLIRCAFVPGAAGRTYNLAGPETLPMADVRRVVAEVNDEVLRPSNGSKATRPERHPRSYPRPLLDAYYHAGRLGDALLGLRLPYFEKVSFLTADRELDITRARFELGYDPKVHFREAAHRSADWYHKNGML